MIKFKRDDIPKGACFSHEGMCGSYYEDTDTGENKSWHQYDKHGLLYRTSIRPSSLKEYYISDAKGNPLPGERKNFYQFMCKHEYGGYKLTTAKYQTATEAQLARARDSKWHVLDAYRPSCEIRFVPAEIVWQWIYEVEPGTNGYTERFNLSSPLTEDEAYTKFRQSVTIKSYYKITKSEKTRDCK